MKILNLTQHRATPEQIAQGVIEPTWADKEVICKALTFDEPPSFKEVSQRLEILGRIIIDPDIDTIMVGGAPFFMTALEQMIKSIGCVPVYSFSKRESRDIVQGDGSVKKASTFKHISFVGPLRG